MRMSKVQRDYINRRENFTKKLPMLDDMLSHAHVASGGAALEIGCGPGYMSAALRDRGFKVTGTDVDPAEIDFATKNSRGEEVTFLEADATALPFDDSQFDLVLSMMVLHHIRAWPETLSEIVRVLKPGGYYLLNDFTYSAALKLLGPLFLRGHAFYRIEEITGFLRDRGMRPISESPPHKYLYNQFTEYNLVFQKE